MALDKVKIGVLDGASTGVKSDRYNIPSVTTSQRDAGSFSAAVGDLIFNSTIGKLQQYDGNNASFEYMFNAQLKSPNAFLKFFQDKKDPLHDNLLVNLHL